MYSKDKRILYRHHTATVNLPFNYILFEKLVRQKYYLYHNILYFVCTASAAVFVSFRYVNTHARRRRRKREKTFNSRSMFIAQWSIYVRHHRTPVTCIMIRRPWNNVISENVRKNQTGGGPDNIIISFIDTQKTAFYGNRACSSRCETHGRDTAATRVRKIFHADNQQFGSIARVPGDFSSNTSSSDAKPVVKRFTIPLRMCRHHV